MFVRKKKNPSGIAGIQVIDKSNNRYKVVKTIGSSSGPVTTEELCLKGKQWISSRLGEQDIFEVHNKAQEELQVATSLLSNIENILLNGTQLILDQVFKLVGFDAVKDEILKDLVIARICQPSGKAGTVDYLKSYFYQDIELHKIYRYLDKLQVACIEKR